jgi:hypothetical protein
MRRRQFVTGFAMATLWPVAVRAQRGERVRHIAILYGVRRRFGSTGQFFNVTDTLSGSGIGFTLRWAAPSCTI